MSLLSSILNLAFVVGAGWFVIYYLVPKFESGELGLGGLSYPTGGQGGAEGSDLEEQVIPSDITDAALGDEPGTTEEMVEEQVAPKKGKQKKGKGEWLSSDKAGKDNRKKSKKKSKAEMRIMEYLGDYYGLY